MAKITTHSGQTIALEYMPPHYVITLQHTDGEVLAQIGLTTYELFELLEEEGLV